MAHSRESHLSLSNLLHNKEDEDSFLYAVQITNSTAISMAMQAAVELGVFEVIHRVGPTARLSAADIASKLSCKNSEAPSMLDRLLRILVDNSVLQCTVENQERGCVRRLYGLTRVAEFFLPNVKGGSLGPLLLLTQFDKLTKSWSQLKDSVLEGGSAFKRTNGSDIYDYLCLDLKLSEVFQEAMLNYTIVLMNNILESYKGFGDITSLVDVGGGLGITLKLITSKYPHIRGINFDLPHVIHSAPPYPGVEHVEGDMFESVPKGDAIFMRWILQDWSDEHCVKLLKNCYDAIPKNGKVIVANAVLDTEPDTSPVTTINNQYEIILMAYTGGRERSKHELLNLVKSSGFSGIRFECLVCGLWVMEFYK